MVAEEVPVVVGDQVVEGEEAGEVVAVEEEVVEAEEEVVQDMAVEAEEGVMEVVEVEEEVQDVVEEGGEGEEAVEGDTDGDGDQVVVEEEAAGAEEGGGGAAVVVEVDGVVEASKGPPQRVLESMRPAVSTMAGTGWGSTLVAWARVHARALNSSALFTAMPLVSTTVTKPVVPTASQSETRALRRLKINVCFFNS